MTKIRGKCTIVIYQCALASHFPQKSRSECRQQEGREYEMTDQIVDITKISKDPCMEVRNFQLGEEAEMS